MIPGDQILAKLTAQSSPVILKLLSKPVFRSLFWKIRQKVKKNLFVERQINRQNNSYHIPVFSYSAFVVSRRAYKTTLTLKKIHFAKTTHSL